MIVYWDTSAFVPLLVSEPASTSCAQLWTAADTVVSSRLLFAEAAAALAQGYRLGRLTINSYESSVGLLGIMWNQMDVVEVDDALVRRAARLAHLHHLRGYDAVHCASAEELRGPDVVAASGDRHLLDAWQRLGVPTYDTSYSAG